MHHFKELKVWQRSMDAAQATYKLCSLFPDTERYGLTSQMRRAAASIPYNISEGAGRNSNAEFRHFLSITAGSAYELETQFLLAERFNYLRNEQVAPVLNELVEIQKMIYGLRNNLRD